jgi:chemotaxis-related protein WspD
VNTVAVPLVAHCWNRIGVNGDRSCPELVGAIHCRNCPVYSTGGQRLYDRDPPPGYTEEWTDRIAAAEPLPPGPSIPAVVLRVASEWLALGVEHVAEVAPAQAVRRVPHQTDRVFAGLVNIRGELHLAISLRHLLGVADEDPATTAAGRRWLVVQRAGARWVLVTDEVVDVEHVPADSLAPLPETVATGPAVMTRGVFPWNGRAVGLLDPDRLFAALKRSFR